MFTGIIEVVGAIDAVVPLEGGRRMRIACPFAQELRVDESVAVDGVCLTVVATGSRTFEAVAVEETLDRSTLAGLREGDAINLERAVQLGGRLDGHMVQGHVDAVGEIVAIDELADSHVARVAYPVRFADNLVEKGSVAVSGISLTVARLDDAAGAFDVAVIPHTWAHTTAMHWAPGSRVNLEFDLVGKYVLRAGRPGADT